MGYEDLQSRLVKPIQNTGSGGQQSAAGILGRLLDRLMCMLFHPLPLHCLPDLSTFSLPCLNIALQPWPRVHCQP